MNTYPAKAGRPQPRANAQMEGTILPLFHQDIVYWHGHRDGINVPSYRREAVQQTCFKTRATLARIVAESRRK